MSIRTHESVFLGVVVNPKTKAPVYVVRREHTEMTVDIWSVRQPTVDELALAAGKPIPPMYGQHGAGYLNEDPDYAAPTTVSGYPRSHTPVGVEIKGGGYGTCLYTGLVLLATARFNGEIVLPRTVRGDAAGISSTGSDGTRSAAADAWWSAAYQRGLTDREYGEDEVADEDRYEKEEITNENLRDYLSRLSYQRLVNEITQTIEGQTEWTVDDVVIKVDMNRQVEIDMERRSGQSVLVDVYTMESAIKHHLVCLTNTQRGGIFSWASYDPGNNLKHVDVEAILALNVAREDVRMVARLAAVAKAKGATDAQVTQMLMRNRFGADIVSRQLTYDEAPGGRVMPREIAEAAIDALARNPGRRRRQPRPERGTQPPNHAPIPAQRNPSIPSASDRKTLERDLTDLESRRRDLGWHEIEDL